MRILIAVTVLGAFAAMADERTFVFRSEEDPSTPPDPAVCAASPFGANVKLGAALYSIRTSRTKGLVRDETWKRIGKATACLELTNVMFPAGLVQNFYAQFDLPQGRYVAQGTCTVSSNTVPQNFIILAGCTLKLITGPAGSNGGMATSASIFNPLKQAGFGTGSIWTIHEYFTPAPHTHGPPCQWGWGHPHDHDEDD